MDWLADRGFQPEFGARPLRRTVQKELDNKLSGLLLAGTLAPGDAVRVDADSNGLVVERVVADIEETVSTASLDGAESTD